MHTFHSLIGCFVVVFVVVFQVETIGDAYMVASGLPVRNGEKHVTEMADVSLTLLKCVLNFQIPHKPDKHLLIRIGSDKRPQCQ